MDIAEGFEAHHKWCAAVKKAFQLLRDAKYMWKAYTKAGGNDSKISVRSPTLFKAIVVIVLGISVSISIGKVLWVKSQVDDAEMMKALILAAVTILASIIPLVPFSWAVSDTICYRVYDYRSRRFLHIEFAVEILIRNIGIWVKKPDDCKDFESKINEQLAKFNLVNKSKYFLPHEKDIEKTKRELDVAFTDHAISLCKWIDAVRKDVFPECLLEKIDSDGKVKEEYWKAASVRS